MKVFFSVSLYLLALAALPVQAQTPGNIAIYKESESKALTELRADQEALTSTAKKGVKIATFNTTQLRYVIYDITNGRTAVVKYFPKYPTGLTTKKYWVEEAVQNVFPYTRLPLPQSGTEQWLRIEGSEAVLETTPGVAGINADATGGIDTWGLTGSASHWSGKATPFLFSPGNTEAVPRSIVNKRLETSHEFAFRVFSGSSTTLRHKSAPITSTLTLDTVLTGKANTKDIVVVGNPNILARTIENGVEQVLAALRAQKYEEKP